MSMAEELRMVTLVERWRVVDKWWTGTPVAREFALVRWWPDCEVVMTRSNEDVWRVAAHALA